MDICTKLNITQFASLDTPLIAEVELKKALGLSVRKYDSYATTRIRALGLILGKDVERIVEGTIGCPVQYRFTLRSCYRVAKHAKGIQAKGVAKELLQVFPELEETANHEPVPEPEPMPYLTGQYDPMTNTWQSERIVVESEANGPIQVTYDDVWGAQEEPEMQVLEPEVIEESTMALTLWQRVERSVTSDEYPFPVLGRELHAALGLNRDYTKWFQDQLDRLNRVRPQFFENQHYKVFVLKDENPKCGRPSINHEMCREMAKHIALISETEEGFNIRKRIIEIEEQFTRMVQTGTLGLSNDSTPAVSGLVAMASDMTRVHDKYLDDMAAIRRALEKAIETPVQVVAPTPKALVVEEGPRYCTRQWVRSMGLELTDQQYGTLCQRVYWLARSDGYDTESLQNRTSRNKARIYPVRYLEQAYQKIFDTELVASVA